MIVASTGKERHLQFMFLPARQSIWAYAFALFSLIALARFLLMLPLGLVEDEAYYWVWAQTPSAGYFDHTAGVGLIGWLWQQVFGLNFLGFRVLNGLLSLITGFASLAACLSLLPPQEQELKRKGLFAGAGLIVIVLAFTSVHAGHVAWVPDAVYLPCLSLAIWQICRLLGPFHTPKDYSSPKLAWAWAGLFLGLSILAKEIVVLYAALFCLFALIHTRLRHDLRTSPWPWLGLAFIILGGIPTLIWNAQNDWILLLYQSNHAFVDRSTNLEWQDFVSLSLTYLILLGPALILVWTRLKETWVSHWPLWALFIFPSIGFFGIALLKGLQTQWALPSIHLGMLLLLPLAIQHKGKGQFWLVVSALFFSTLLYLVLAVRPIGLRAHNVQPVLAWDAIYKEMRDYQASAEDRLGEPIILLGNRYQEASLLNYSRAQETRFQINDSQEVSERTLLPSLNFESRSNHYDYLWPELEIGGQLALLVIRNGNIIPDGIFEEVIETGSWRPDGVQYNYQFGRLIKKPRQHLKKL